LILLSCGRIWKSHTIDHEVVEIFVGLQRPHRRAPYTLGVTAQSRLGTEIAETVTDLASAARKRNVTRPSVTMGDATAAAPAAERSGRIAISCGDAGKAIPTAAIPTARLITARPIL
jgi:hypothetical protein